jgi:hypothetical protein
VGVVVQLTVSARLTIGKDTMKKRYRRRCLIFFAIGILLVSISPSLGQLTARITVTQGRLDTVCGTHNIKVVFMCQNSGYFVDFSESTPRIRQMANVTNAYFPVISSDGRLVTYQTDVEVEGPSTNPLSGKVWLRELAANGTPVKIADTGYVPRFVQNTPADTPTIIYSTSVACPQSICYTSGQTVKRAIVDKTPLLAEIVFDGGCYYGGLSWDNRYLITGWPGGPNGFMLDLQNSSAGPHAVHTMRVKKTGTDIDTFVSIGTCNISRSASRVFTNTMLYYDFGSKELTTAKCIHPLLGTWKEHALLFISRYDAEDVKVFAMPAERTLVSTVDAQGLGEVVGKEWYFPEWSNHPYYGVASLNIDRLWLRSGSWEHTYNTESIYLIGLKDSQYVKIIESSDTLYASTTSFKYPHTWVEIPDGFQEDSTWLAKTIWDRNAVRNPFRNPKRLTSATALLSDQQVTEISLFSISGRRIATIRPGASITLEKVRKLVGPGNYFIGIRLKGKQPEYIRIVNIQ